ncbi:MAG: DUF402 domain-containing protein [Lachnospiraceae bacterium]|nr:DUF402 domain-containing protein [Lachnospiraceae bacterium]
MKIKTISRDGWNRILSGREYVSTKKREEFDGILALFYLEKVTGPLVKIMEDKQVVLADDDYYWMQFGPRGENYWLTVMFDRKREIVQWYFDITLRNELDAEGGPRFFDLYLDLVVLPSGTNILLDEDELLEAYRAGEFSKEIYDMAYRKVSELQEKLCGRVKELNTFTRKYFFELLEEAGWG